MPPDWELLQFSKAPDAGRCAFADRHAFRLELSWRAVAGPPDLERMVSDYMSALEEKGMQEIVRRSHGEWRGGEGVVEGLRMTRYGGFLQAEACVVEAVFLWPDGRVAGLEASVLDSIRVCPPTPAGYRIWQAFGMRMMAPADATLQAAEILPAHAEMRFAGKRRGSMAVFSRRGMVDAWLRATPGAWLARWVRDKGADDGTSGERVVGTHRVAQWRGRARARGLRRSPAPCVAEAWICPGDGRLYSWLAVGVPFAAGADRLLACCSGLNMEMAD